MEGLHIHPGLEARGTSLDIVLPEVLDLFGDLLAVSLQVATVCKVQAIAIHVPDLPSLQDKVLQIDNFDARVAVIVVDPILHLFVGLLHTVVCILVLPLCIFPVVLVVRGRQDFLPLDGSPGREVLDDLDGLNDRRCDVLPLTPAAAVVDANGQVHNARCHVSVLEDPVGQREVAWGVQTRDSGVKTTAAEVVKQVLLALPIAKMVHDGVSHDQGSRLGTVAFGRAQMALCLAFLAA
mmetsp:Transcript_34873/g.98889  ORF Transcript_34873/g.98889 Transcript_34873/m.98889 type:complete len:237 (+) Transcript_34873:702-1412(+)